jgi:MATE family multidrug resistance protein
MVNTTKATPTRLQDLKHISSLAGPLVLTNLLYVAIATIDIIMLGMLSPADLAAGGLAIAIFNQFRTMGTGLVTATGNLVSYAQGKGDTQRVTRLLNDSLILGTFASVVFTVLMLVFKPVLQAIGTEGEVAAKTEEYLGVAAIGMLPCFWFQSVRHFSVGLKSPGPLLAITGLSVVMAAGLNYGLIFGAFGLPKLGFIGVAVATVIVLFASFFIFIVFAMGHSALKRHISWRVWAVDRASVIDICKMGFPIAATYGFEAGFFTALSLLVATLGVNELAAHTVVSQIVYIVFMVAAGISAAASIYISEACARQAFAHAKRIAHLGLVAGLSVMALVMVAYLSFPQWVLYAFLSADELQNSQVTQIATGILFIAAMLQFFDASQNIGIGVLRGVGDVTSALKLSVVGYWFIGLPCAWLLSIKAGLGIHGVWYGLMLGLSITAISQVIVFEKRIVALNDSAAPLASVN